MTTHTFMQQIYNTYESLCDEKSKEIFLSRLLYNVTKDEKHLESLYIDPNKDYGFPLEELLVGSAADEDTTASLLQQLTAVCGGADCPIIIYGAGTMGQALAPLLINKGFSVKCFWDRSKKLQENNFLGLDVYEPFSQVLSDEILLITSPSINIPIDDLSAKLSIPKERIIVPHWKPIYADTYNQYFENAIIAFQEDEVFIDGGSFDFGTSLLLLKHVESVKKIYAFEPEASKWDEIAAAADSSDFANAEIIKAGLWSRKDVLRFFADNTLGSSINDEGTVTIEVEALDSMNIPEKITFIKLDIEGAELEALKGAKNVIRNNRPKLAICIYHRPEDIIEIPTYIKSLVPDYKLYIRHYSNCATETILYAI